MTTVTDIDLPKWLDDIWDEYMDKEGKIKYRSTGALVRLFKTFVDEEDRVMELASAEYIKLETYFPRVSALYKYVLWAREQARGELSYPEVTQLLGRGIHFADDEMLVFEQERGSMPADDKLETEWLKEVE